MIVSIVVGIIIGEGIDIDSRVNSVVKRIESKFFRKKGKNNIAQGFISASLLFLCWFNDIGRCYECWIIGR